MTEIMITRWFPHDLLLDREVAVIGDVHGVSDAFGALLDQLAADLHVVQLGDLMDRGPDSLGAIRMADERIAKTRGTLLPGNHEGLMLEAFDFLDDPESFCSEGRDWHGFDDPIHAWLSNGGGSMLREIDPVDAMERSDAVRRVRDALPDGYEAGMRNAPSHMRCGDLLIVHGGLHPKSSDPEGWLAQRLTLDAANAPHPHFDHWAWARGDFLRWNHGWDRYGARVVIHGHTPPWTRAHADASELSTHLDRLGTVGRLCVDGGSFANGTVAAVEMRERRYRLLGAVGNRS